MAFHGAVAPEWQERGVLLAEAAEAYHEQSGQLLTLHNMMLEGRARFTELSGGTTPEAFEMLESSLTGEARKVELLAKLDSEERAAWHKYNGGMSALRVSLTFRLQTGWLRAFGDPVHPGESPEWIPVRAWFHLKEDESERNKVTGAAKTYWFVRVVDPTLAVCKRPGKMMTGVAGRPLLTHFAANEMRRRAAAGQMKLSVGQEAAELAAWFARAHPDERPLQAKGIENATRALHRQLKSEYPKS